MYKKLIMFVSTIGILARPTSVPLIPTYTMCGRTDWTWNDVTNPTTGRIWMDRNLGANRVGTARNDDQSYGMLYQWGRLSDGHQCVNRYTGDGVTTSLTTTTVSSIDVPTTTRFILNTDWRVPRNDNLWQGVNGINNPCPTGYRLPTETELVNEYLSWGSLSQQNYTGAFNSTRKWTTGGYRLNTMNGITNIGTVGYIWSGTVSGVGSSALVYEVTGAGVNTGVQRGLGYSVRCTKN